MIIFPFFILLIDLYSDKEFLKLFEEIYVPIIGEDNFDSQLILASIISLSILIFIVMMYLFAWIVSVPITYSVYTIVWLFNKYLIITSKFHNNMVSAIIFILWLITLVLSSINI